MIKKRSLESITDMGVACFSSNTFDDYEPLGADHDQSPHA